ncbi:hypothetical protein ACLI09_02575 [Flavobacterium sp. RHBU_24]|uniref:hypothetical protein n=1 Tax=Flavobacterium sp. RHBU_24 TaxID=3391185 RepID=UPI0039846367
MKTQSNSSAIATLKTKRQWELHQQLGAFASSLNRLHDANEVKANRAQSAPLSLLPMVFKA